MRKVDIKTNTRLPNKRNIFRHVIFCLSQYYNDSEVSGQTKTSSKENENVSKIIITFLYQNGIFLQTPCFQSGHLGNFVVVYLFSVSTELYQHTFPCSSSRLSATDTANLSGVQLSIPSSVTYSQAPACGFSYGENVGGI
jgi:hypothetical protein